MILAPTLCDHPTVVYLLATSDVGPTKIGVTTNLQERVASIQIGCWHPLRIYSARLAILRQGFGRRAGLLAEFKEAAHAVEATTLSVAEDMGCRLMGEWLALSPQKALMIARHCAEGRGAGLFGLEDFAALDIGWADPSMQRARSRIVRSLAQIATFAVEHNDRHKGY